MKLGVPIEIQQATSHAAFIHAIDDQVIDTNGIHTNHGITAGPRQTGAALPRWPGPLQCCAALNQHSITVKWLGKFHRAAVDPAAVVALQHEARAGLRSVEA